MDKNKLAKAISNLIPQIIRGAHADFFTKSSVTQTQFLMLLAIEGFGACTMSTLARNMKVRMPTATGIADRLVKAGFIKRNYRAEDRRTVWVSLTAKGESYIQGFKKVVKQRWGNVLKVLNKKEIRNFYTIVVKLTASLQPPS